MASALCDVPAKADTDALQRHVDDLSQQLEVAKRTHCWLEQHNEELQCELEDVRDRGYSVIQCGARSTLQSATGDMLHI